MKFTKEQFMKRMFFDLQDYRIDINYMNSDNRVSSLPSSPRALAKYFKSIDYDLEIFETELKDIPSAYRVFKWVDDGGKPFIATFIKI